MDISGDKVSRIEITARRELLKTSIGDDEPALVWFKKAGMRRPGLGGGPSSTSRNAELDRADKVRPSRERCLLEGGAGGVTVRVEGIMALKEAGGAKTLGIAIPLSLSG